MLRILSFIAFITIFISSCYNPLGAGKKNSSMAANYSPGINYFPLASSGVTGYLVLQNYPTGSIHAGLIVPPVTANIENASSVLAEILALAGDPTLYEQYLAAGTGNVGTATLRLYTDAQCTIPAPNSPNGTPALSGATAPLSSSGVTFSNVVISVVGSNFCLAVSTNINYVTPEGCRCFAVTSGTTPGALTMTFDSSTTIFPNQNILASVIVYDTYGNMATNYNGPINLSSSDPRAVFNPPSAQITATSGVGSLVVTLFTATTSGTLYASIGAASGNIGGIVVNAGGAASFIFLNLPSGVLPNVPFSFFIQAVDSYNNLNPSVTELITLTSSDPAATIPSPIWITNGEVQVTMTLATPTPTAGGSLTASGSLNPAQGTIYVSSITTSDSNISPLNKLFVSADYGLYQYPFSSGAIDNGANANTVVLNATPVSYTATADSASFYLLEQGNAQISQYTIVNMGSPAGLPVPLSPATAALTAAIDGTKLPNKNAPIIATPQTTVPSYVYVLNTGVTAGASLIEIFTWNGGGPLSSSSTMPVNSPAAGNVDGATLITPANMNCVFVGAHDSSNNLNFISTFSSNSGSLTAVQDGGTANSLQSRSADIMNLSIAALGGGTQYFLIATEATVSPGYLTIFSLDSTSCALSGGLQLATSDPSSNPYLPQGAAIWVGSTTSNVLYTFDSNQNIYLYPITASGLSSGQAASKISASGLLGNLQGLDLTPDGNFLNVLAADGIYTYSINPASGQLTLAQTTKGPSELNAYQLQTIYDLSSSYALSATLGLVQIFSRNSGTGALNYLPDIQPIASTSINDLGTALAATNDNNYLYYAWSPSSGSSAIHQYALNPFAPLSPASVSSQGVVYSMATFDNQYLYVSYVSQGTTIDRYNIAAGAGTLTFAASYSMPNSGNEITSVATVITPSNNHFLYAVDTANNAIYQYAIASGALTLLTPNTPVGVATNAPYQIAITENAQYAYVADSGNNGILSLAINPGTGQLSPVSAETVDAGAVIYKIVLSPDSSLLYALATSGGKIKLYAYIINTDGTLTPVGGQTTYTGLPAPQPVSFGTLSLEFIAAAISRDSNYLYIASYDGEIQQYSISHTSGSVGTLTALSPASVTAESGLLSLMWR